MANHKSATSIRFQQEMIQAAINMKAAAQQAKMDQEVQKQIDGCFLKGNLWVPNSVKAESMYNYLAPIHQNMMATMLTGMYNLVPELKPKPPVESVFEVNMMEPLVGWKSWYIENGILESSSQSSEWKPLEKHVAVCKVNKSWYPKTRHGENESSPAEYCHCGIYAGDSKDSVQEYIDKDEKFNVIGEVYGWGRYIRGEDGWRAQYAYPKFFIIEQKAEECLPVLMEYKVPIFVNKSVQIYDPLEDDYNGNWPEEENRNFGTLEGTDTDESDGEEA